jgi:hypothetical protein
MDCISWLQDELRRDKSRLVRTDQEYRITEDLSVSPCKHTEDGYCLRNENDYCKDGECNCPHDIAQTRVLATACGCETTAEYCISCNEQLSEPKTEC